MKKLIKALKFSAIILFSLIVIFVINLTIYNHIGNSSIKAQIDGLGTRIFILSYHSVSGKNESFKIALCINDRINIKASVKELCGAKFHFINKKSSSRANQIRFFLEPSDEIIINGSVNANSISYNIVKGNKLSIQYSKLQKDLSPFFENEFELKQKYRQTHQAVYKKQLDSLIHYTT